MLTNSSSGISRAAAAKLYKTYQPVERTSRPAETSSAHSNYDSFSISPAPTGEDRFQIELVSRLSKEIRTHTTTGDIQNLRTQVANGAYEVNAAAIAARMLHLSEV